MDKRQDIFRRSAAFSKDLNVKYAEVVPSNGSDHRPMIMEFDVK